MPLKNLALIYFERSNTSIKNLAFIYIERSNTSIKNLTKTKKTNQANKTKQANQKKESQEWKARRGWPKSTARRGPKALCGRPDGTALRGKLDRSWNRTSPFICGRTAVAARNGKREGPSQLASRRSPMRHALHLGAGFGAVAGPNSRASVPVPM